jgi:preprotein translocase subunit YajC
MTMNNFLTMIICFSCLVLLFAFYKHMIVRKQNDKMKEGKDLFDERDCFNDSVDLITWNKELRALRD